MKPQAPRSCCVRQIGQVKMPGRPRPILPKIPRPAPTLRPILPPRRPGI